jgi:HEAT repeat protein
MPLVRKGAGAAAPGPDAGDVEAQLRTGTSDERWTAARALSGKSQAVKVLGAALAVEPDARVREAILTGLVRIDTAESAEAIVPLLRSDDAGLRTGALDALRVMPHALAAHLSRLLSDPDADVRLLACDLARQLPPPAATRRLCELLAGEPEANVCAAAVDVLAECGDPEALPVLSACAVRFAHVPFLTFSLRIAGDRIRAQAPAHDG